jgi:hypothetical protein
LRAHIEPLKNCSPAVASSPIPGKSRTWNTFVHEIAEPDADFLLFMDADIQIVGANSLEVLLLTLIKTPHAHAAVDTILKDIALAEQPTALQRLSIEASSLQSNGPAKIAGSLYLIRAPIARALWLPIGLLVEDGFLKAMLTTEQFTNTENSSRIVRADSARHTFHAQTRPFDLFRHEKRLLLGTAQNILLFEHLRTLASHHNDPSFTAEWIRTQNENDPHWLHSFTRNGFKTKGWRMLPWEVLLLPFTQLSKLPTKKQARTFPVSVLRSLFNATALAGAALDLKRDRLRW